MIDRVAVIRGVQPTVASVTEIMETWSLQRGYPLIRVEHLSDRAVAVSQVSISRTTFVRLERVSTIYLSAVNYCLPGTFY